MSDNIDSSVEHQQVVLESLLQQRVNVPRLKANGRCHFCDEDIEMPKLFCNGDCADDFDKYK